MNKTYLDYKEKMEKSLKYSLFSSAIGFIFTLFALFIPFLSINALGVSKKFSFFEIIINEFKWDTVGIIFLVMIIAGLITDLIYVIKCTKNLRDFDKYSEQKFNYYNNLDKTDNTTKMKFSECGMGIVPSLAGFLCFTLFPEYISDKGGKITMLNGVNAYIIFIIFLFIGSLLCYIYSIYINNSLKNEIKSLQELDTHIQDPSSTNKKLKNCNNESNQTEQENEYKQNGDNATE